MDNTNKSTGIQSPEQQPLDYIIEYTGAARATLLEQLARYPTRASTLIPAVYVRVDAQQEQSLLELLAELPGITYRRAEERHALGAARTTEAVLSRGERRE